VAVPVAIAEGQFVITFRPGGLQGDGLLQIFFSLWIPVLVAQQLSALKIGLKIGTASVAHGS
jgi:hypothetical protein